MVEPAPPPPPVETAEEKAPPPPPQAVPPAPPVANVPAFPCWDGTGPAIEGATTEVFPPLTITKGYPAKIAVPDAAERARREAVLAARNRGVVFTLSATGDVAAVTTQRISCASQNALALPRSGGKVPVARPEDLALIAELAARNPDVVAAGSLGFGSFVKATDGTWSMLLTAATGEPAYRRLATTLRATTLNDSRILAAFNKVARLERIRVRQGDSCGPQCGPPPVATTVLGSRAITRKDGIVQRYTAIYLADGALIVRKVAGFQLTAGGTQLSNGVKLVDAVTGAKVSFDVYDMFE